MDQGAAFDAEDEAVAPEGEAAPAADATEADAPIIKLVYQLILEAIQRRASDIHVEPLEKRFRVRYRIDGVLIDDADDLLRMLFGSVEIVAITATKEEEA